MLKKSGNKLVRNWVFVITVAFTVSLISTTCSQAKEERLVILGLGGKVQETITRYAKECGIEVLYRRLPYYAGATAVQSLPEIGAIDLFIAHDVLIRQIGDLGMLEELDLEDLKKDYHLFLYPSAELESKYAVAIGTIATGIAYLPTKVSAAPHSWRDLYKPAPKELEGHIAIPDISTVYGWQNIAVAASLEEKKSDEKESLVEGFNKIEQLKPFYLTDNPNDLADLFRQEKVWISPCQSDSFLRLKEKEKLPLEFEFIYPDEGVPLLKIAVSRARDTTRPDLADRFIGLLLSTEFQERAANDLYWGPVNSKTPLKERVRKVLSHGELGEIRIDWLYIDANKFELTEKWSRLFYEHLFYKR